MERLVIPKDSTIEGEIAAISHEGDIVIESGLKPESITSRHGSITLRCGDGKLKCQRLLAPEGALDVENDVLIAQEVEATTALIKTGRLEIQKELTIGDNLKIDADITALTTLEAGDVDIRADDFRCQILTSRGEVILEAKAIRIEELRARRLVVRGALECNHVVVKESVQVESGAVAIKKLDCPIFEAAPEVTGIVMVATSDMVKAQGVRGFLRPSELDLFSGGMGGLSMEASPAPVTHQPESGQPGPTEEEPAAPASASIPAEFQVKTIDVDEPSGQLDEDRDPHETDTRALDEESTDPGYAIADTGEEEVSELADERDSEPDREFQLTPFSALGGGAFDNPAQLDDEITTSDTESTVGEDSDDLPRLEEDEDGDAWGYRTRADSGLVEATESDAEADDEDVQPAYRVFGSDETGPGSDSGELAEGSAEPPWSGAEPVGDPEFGEQTIDYGSSDYFTRPASPQDEPDTVGVDLLDNFQTQGDIHEAGNTPSPHEHGGLDDDILETREEDDPSEVEELTEDDLYSVEDTGTLDSDMVAEMLAESGDETMPMDKALTRVLDQIRAYFPDENYPKFIYQIQHYVEENRIGILIKARNKEAVLSSFDKLNHPEISTLARKFYEVLESYAGEGGLD